MKPVVDKELCYSCGLCISICPVNAISLKKVGREHFHAEIDEEKCIDCGLCTKVCPVNAWENIHIIKDHSKKEIERSLKPFVELGFGYACDEKIRQRGSSGGLLIACLRHLLRTKKVQGVVLANSTGFLEGRFSIVRAEKDLLKAQKSKYFYIPFTLTLKELLKYKSLAVVGSPCHLEGIRKACELNSILNKTIKYRFSLFCASNLYKAVYPLLMQKEGIKKVKNFSFRPGNWWDYNYFTSNNKILSFRKGLVQALVPSRLVSRKPCLMCPDFTGGSADISFGDAWHPKFKGNKQGYNFYICRTRPGQRLLRDLEKAEEGITFKTDIDEFVGSYLTTPLFFKQEAIVDRASYLKLKGRAVLKRIPTESTNIRRFRAGLLYNLRSILFFAQKHKILKILPKKIIILYGWLTILLSRRGSLTLLKRKWRR